MEKSVGSKLPTKFQESENRVTEIDILSRCRDLRWMFVNLRSNEQVVFSIP